MKPGTLSLGDCLSNILQLKTKLKKSSQRIAIYLRIIESLGKRSWKTNCLMHGTTYYHCFLKLKGI